MREWIREYAFPIIVLCFFAGYFANSAFNQAEVVKFVHEGPRNTAQQGYHLCLRINTLEMLNELHPSNCEEIYYK